MSATAPVIESERACGLYRSLVLIREFENALDQLFASGIMRGTAHFCVGQEATAVGLSAALKKGDYVISYHRGHGHFLAQGGDPKRIMAELFGKEAGYSFGRGGSQHVSSFKDGFLGSNGITGGGMPVGTGAALALKMKGTGGVSVVFFGDGAANQGAFHESMNLGSIWKLPVVYVCENNLYSVYSPLGVRQPEGQSVIGLAQGHGIESYEADGNDVMEVYNLSRRLIQEARGGGGPRFVEFKTYRWREHCGPAYDNDIGYRTEVEFQQWKERCPIEGLETRLLEEGTLSPPDIKRMRSQVGEEIENAVAYAKQSSFPDESNLMESVYAP